jgi:hypothetical protein
MTPISTIKQKVEKDIWDWITGYIEVNHKFYDYKFPPCPYARGARLKGLLDVQAYESGPINQFIEQQTTNLVNAKQYNVRVLAFPPRTKWLPHVKRFVTQLNEKIVTKDYYSQFGFALNTQSQYPGLFNSGPYFIVIINRLSDVLAGHQALLNTDYYKPWAKHHYDAVVTRRQQMYEKYKDK